MRIHPLLIPTAALGLLLACCSARTSNTTASTSDASASSSGQQTADATAVIDPCTKLSKADMAPYFIPPIATVRHDDNLIGQAAGCQYATAVGRSSIDVIIVTGSHAQAFFDASKTDNGVAAVPMSGIGDNAVRRAHDVWVSAIKGDVFCGVSGQHGSVSSKGTGELVGLKDYDTSDEIPDAVALPVATRLGAICSKLFSTG